MKNMESHIKLAYGMMEWCWRDVSYNYSRKLSFYASQEPVISGSLVRLPNVVQRKKTDVFGDRGGHPNDPLRSNGRFWAEAICPTRELAMQAVRFCELARWWPTLQNNSEYFFQEMKKKHQHWLVSDPTKN